MISVICSGCGEEYLCCNGTYETIDVNREGIKIQTIHEEGKAFVTDGLCPACEKLEEELNDIRI